MGCFNRLGLKDQIVYIPETKKLYTLQYASLKQSGWPMQLSKQVFKELIGNLIANNTLLGSIIYTDDYKFVLNLFKKLNQEKLVRRIDSQINNSFKRLGSLKTPKTIGKQFAQRYMSINSSTSKDSILGQLYQQTQKTSISSKDGKDPLQDYSNKNPAILSTELINTRASMDENNINQQTKNQVKLLEKLKYSTPEINKTLNTITVNQASANEEILKLIKKQ